EPAKQGVNRRERTMHNCVEVFVPNSRQVTQPYSPICRRAAWLAAVHSDVMAPLGQSHRDLFGKRFETTVISRNTARTQQANAHPPKGQRGQPCYVPSFRDTGESLLCLHLRPISASSVT